jgi:hypothetical protein
VIPDKLKFPFAEILDCNVSPDFQVVLKKMNKKDSTTKLKVSNDVQSNLSITGPLKHNAP